MSVKKKTAAEVSVFLVEDDPRFRETFTDVMSLRGVSVRSAGSAAEAMRELRTARPSIILVDVQLPDIHGFELCRLIKKGEAFSDTPVILISASAQYNDPRDRVEGLLSGASLFLPKPLTIDQIWAEIEQLLGPR